MASPPSAIQPFVEAARAFCAWCETPLIETPENSVALQGLSVLSRLYAAAFLLRAECRFTGDAPVLSAIDSTKVAGNLAQLPFQYYALFFVPERMQEASVIADLADDFAGIYSDVKKGLNLYEAGEPEHAIWEWWFSFQHHWGHHATNAMFASLRDELYLIGKTDVMHGCQNLYSDE